ncbi:hypothetical protein DM02DRAFT_340448 [Periconia macrospinosa]|uniref:Uncharacterized protein n=1 Tax=Periconia macrospinosa TaxID=97972 RepID=A0A2V1D0A4_9PLEO|nr:hypothetical protein DM02DRAFT_340448 [Periconia macrospinosa]
MSLASAPSDDNDPHPAVTLDSQGISIGPMTMMCFARLQILKKFPSPEKQHVKGLNYETVIPVRFPSPAWIKTTEYTALQPQTYNDDDGNDVNCAFFSLNLSIYNQEIIPSDWDDTGSSCQDKFIPTPLRGRSTQTTTQDLTAKCSTTPSPLS